MKEITDSLKFKKNESIEYTNLCDMKKVLRGKFIALNTFIKKLGRSYTSNITAHLKAL